MHIVFTEHIPELHQRFTVLELDTFRDPQTLQQRVAWCVIENVPLDQMCVIEQQCAMHQSLINAYKDAQWDQCLAVLDQLRGCWNQELDSFYDILHQRVLDHQRLGTQSGWDYAVPKRFTMPG